MKNLPLLCDNKTFTNQRRHTMVRNGKKVNIGCNSNIVLSFGFSPKDNVRPEFIVPPIFLDWIILWC